MKIYTRTGDKGETGLFGGRRVFKDDMRIAAFGEVDELNAALGMARAALPPANIEGTLADLQNLLFTVGAELATPNPAKKSVPVVQAADVTALEHLIDTFEAQLAPLTNFILPAGTPAAAALHFARAVSRRAERKIVALSRTEGHAVRPELLAFANRLTDLLFVLARAANQIAGQADVPWRKPE
jgi:cob(I)alamin adenosyltransferase